MRMDLSIYKALHFASLFDENKFLRKSPPFPPFLPFPPCLRGPSSNALALAAAKSASIAFFLEVNLLQAMMSPRLEDLQNRMAL